MLRATAVDAHDPPCVFGRRARRQHRRNGMRRARRDDPESGHEDRYPELHEQPEIYDSDRICEAAEKFITLGHRHGQSCGVTDICNQGAAANVT